GGTVAAGTGAVALRRYRRLDASDPCGPAGVLPPAGKAISVTTDDGAELAVTVAGPPAGPTVVLAHCWTGSQQLWAPVARRLVLAGSRVVVYDQRGHGRSTLASGIPSVNRLGRDLATILEAVDASDAVLVGHSMGSMAAIAFAIDHPEQVRDRVRGVVLVSTAARYLGMPLPQLALNRLLGEGHLEWTRRGRIGALTARAALGLPARRTHVTLTRDGFGGTLGSARVECMAAMAAMDLRAGLAGIDVPAVVLVGSLDTLTPLPLGRRVRRLPNADLVVVPGAGHMLPLEAPDRIIDAVVRLQVATPVTLSNVG
ncbi:MAG: alpha/beta fold hydrolase, partial [Acidimicrobiales bacterium]